MFESAEDLISVLGGLIALWFLLGALVSYTHHRGRYRLGRRRRRLMRAAAARSHIR